jgi:glycosyltransferase involved in cell wall biosynthesis
MKWMPLFMTSRLVWNSIVKNESRIIGRALASLLPHIDGAVVADTGSTDDTVELIRRAFAAAGKPVELHTIPFTDFSQARNEALRLARASKLPFDYILLSDADMELRVHDPCWSAALAGQSYDMRQTGGGLTYTNRRLIKHDAEGGYVGITHEYVDIASAGVVAGADFIDHADGANRPDKYARDIALLTAALAVETRPGLIERYHFYLAQSYFDSGDFEQAITHYRKRVALGGFPEECWFAQRQLAICQRNLGRTTEFAVEALRAYEMRPMRAENLYDLASFYRQRGENFTSLLFSEPAMDLPYPKDEVLFVNDWIHRFGLREEFAICAYYYKSKRRKGAQVVNALALEGSEQARTNLFWYLEKLDVRVPSFTPQPIAFTPEPGWVAMNPSVIEHDGKPLFLVRTVNYAITDDGRYVIGDDYEISPSNPIRTRNFLVSEAGSQEILLPPDFPLLYGMVLGFEDARLFRWKNSLWTLSTVRQANPDGWCEQVLAKVVTAPGGRRALDGWKPILPKERRHEKNWMPWVADDELSFVYRLGSMAGIDGEITRTGDPMIDVSSISGSSQVVQVAPNTFLAVVHEARIIPGRPTRYYQHRFVSFDRHGNLTKISPPFVFHDRAVEFCAGLAYFPAADRLLLSYGVRDCEAWMAWVDLDEVMRFLEDSA